MATIRKEIFVKVSPNIIWDAVRDVGALHIRLVPGFVTDTKLEEGARIVTFATGMVLRELIIDIDDAEQRVAWSVQGEPFIHHNASVQVFEENGFTRIVWIADLLPHELKDSILELIEQGLMITKQTFEKNS